MMKVKEQSVHWRNLAARDWKTAGGLFKIKRYDATLFFCHLTLEKLLKGLVLLHTKHHPPYIHDLERFTVAARLALTPDQINDLKAISAFNIAGRYSDYKFEFHKKCTQPYTEKYLSKTRRLILCLRNHYPKH